MKTRSIFLYISIIIATTVNAEINLKPASLSKISSPDARRKFSLFPKSIKKYVYTEKPLEKVQFSTRRALDITKRTLMPRLLIKSKKFEDTTRFVYKEPVTRPPLMKVKKFLIDLSTNEAKLETSDESNVQNSDSVENDYEEEEVANNHFLTDHTETEENYSDKSVEAEENHTKNGNLSEENNTEIENNSGKLIKSKENYTEKGMKSEEIEITTKTKEAKLENTIKSNVDATLDLGNEYSDESYFTTESELSGITEIESNELGLDQKHTEGIMVSYSNSFISEEENDLSEFIFIEKLPIDAAQFKKKRSINNNIIEEENLGTTISGFKFTGREFHLTNDLSYKNINA